MNTDTSQLKQWKQGSVCYRLSMPTQYFSTYSSHYVTAIPTWPAPSGYPRNLPNIGPLVHEHCHATTETMETG